MTPAVLAASAAPAVTPQPRSRWFWVPSLYFSQGIPYVIVMTLSVVMYKRLGVSNTDIALYTSWLYLPWVLKPLWSPLVDITRTKRFWVVSMQFVVSGGLALAAAAIRADEFFRWSLLLFWLIAFASATHDIAADGFYMLSLSPHEQAWWVGLRSTFYRTAMIVGSGLLVVLAGTLETRNGLAPLDIPVRAAAQAAPSLNFNPGAIKVTAAPGPLRLVARPSRLEFPLTPSGAQDPKQFLDLARKWNQDHGFYQAHNATRATESAPKGFRSPARALTDPLGRAWSAAIAGPLTDFLKAHFPKSTNRVPLTAGKVATLYLTLSRPPAVGQSVIVSLDRQKAGLEYLGLAGGDKGFRLLEGERFVFTSANWDEPAMALVQLDPKLRRESTAIFRASSGNIPTAWSVTLFAVAALFLAFSCWHAVMLPHPPNDGPVMTRRSYLGEFFATLGSFFRKPGIWMALPFILLYRFDEAQLAKVISPFLLDSREAGGLGLATSQVGLAYGTFGILALTAGGLLGGFLAARHGLKRMLPIMICTMYLPKLVFVLLSFAQPQNFLAICSAVAVEQFGYGFGFTAFMLYLLYFAQGPHKTAHYALCTGFMALGMMVPGMWSGWVADLVGYRHFFVWVVCSAVPGFTLALLLKVDPEFGKRAG